LLIIVNFDFFECEIYDNKAVIVNVIMNEAVDDKQLGREG